MVKKAKNKITIEINPGKIEVSSLVDVKIPLRAAEALDKIWEEYAKISKK